MSAATLQTIGAALIAALREVRRPTNPDTPTPTTAPFYTAEWFAGQDLTTATRGSLGRTPAALLAFPGGRPSGPEGEVVATIIDGAQVVLRALWVVYVIVDDPRSDEAAYVGATGEPGMLSVIQTVLAKILGLRIAGLWDGEPRPVLVDVKIGRIVPRQTMVYAVTFATHATVESIEPLSDAEPLERIDGETGPNTDAEDLLTFTADTTT